MAALFDPYVGSGTMLLAAARLGRRWVGIEVKPAFARLIERRMGGWLAWAARI